MAGVKGRRRGSAVVADAVRFSCQQATLAGRATTREQAVGMPDAVRFMERGMSQVLVVVGLMTLCSCR